MSGSKKKTAANTSRKSSAKNKNTDKTSEHIFPRFSNIEDANDVPFFKFYNPQPDPVLKQEHRKMKAREHSLKKPSSKQKQSKKDDKKTEKYAVPKTPKEQRETDERHKKEKKMYCLSSEKVVRVPSPLDMISTPDVTVEKNESAVKPCQIPFAFTKIPKSGIFINYDGTKPMIYKD